MKLIDDGGNFRGIIGTPTNMYDSFMNKLFIGDVVVQTNKDYESAFVSFVEEENISISNQTGTSGKFVMGIRSTWNEDNFSMINKEDEKDSEVFYRKLESFSDGWTVTKVKDYRDLVVNEKIGYTVVVEMEE